MTLLGNQKIIAKENCINTNSQSKYSNFGEFAYETEPI